jgi:FtsP/CotA-like multicopper oxidase with cupredoxin domain
VAPANLPVWPGFSTDVYAINGSVPGPTIRVRRGQEFAARIENQLSEDLVLHWHGILAPERMDGHPRDAVPAGGNYEVRFPVNQRGSTSWYHSHTDLLTAEQVYAGVAGFFIVEDPAEESLGLPTGSHDLPLVIADRRSNAQRQFSYAPTPMDIMTGYLGDLALVNGTPEAWLSVDQGLYRFRLLNGSNARVFKIAFSDGHPFHIVGTDGGLLPAPVQVTQAVLAPGERLEILAEFSDYALGDSIVLKSLAFPSSGGMMMGSLRQGIEMDLMRLYVDEPTSSTTTTVPSTLMPFAPYDPAQIKRTRVFTLAPSGMMLHTINGRLFSMERVDFETPAGELELWEYRNASFQPHPMHMHATHFQVLERVGQTLLAPEDSGWKDTVLVNPGETVRVLVRFDAHPGIFVHHCHNLEHEDTGMMQNFRVLPRPALDIERGPDSTTISWPDSTDGWTLQGSQSLNADAHWETINTTPITLGGRQTVTLQTRTDREFFRLVKP